MATTVMSTAHIPARDRLHAWGDSVWQLIGGLHSDAFGDADFNGTIEHGALDDLRVCRLAVTKHRVVRTPDLIRRSDRGFLKVVAQLHGQACFEQDGKRVWLSPGEWSVYDTTRAYSVHNLGNVEQLVLMLPKENLGDDVLPLEQLMVQRFSGRRGISRLAWDAAVQAMHQLQAPAESLVPPKSAGDMARDISGLVIQSLLERSGRATDVSLRAALRDRVNLHLERHLRDSRLSVAEIAAALNCSKRLLHKAFSAEAHSLEASIVSARLELCRRDLAAPALRHRSITELAMGAGFGNMAHFSRAFRGRYGMSPSEWRALARDPVH